MGILNRLRGKDKQESDVKTPVTLEKASRKSILEEICSNDKQSYLALQTTMNLDPNKLEVTEKEALEKAKGFEKEKDAIRARVWYEVAGAIAIYEGDVKKVKQYFEKCAELSPNRKYPILKNTKKAVEKAQKYYKKISK